MEPLLLIEGMPLLAVLLVFAVGKRSVFPEGSLRPAKRPLALSAVGSQPVPGGTEGAQVNISLPVCHYLGPLQCVCTDAWIYSADVTPELILGYPFLVAYGLTVDTVKHCVLPMECIDVQPSRMICQRVQCVNGSVASVQVRKMERESKEPISDRSRGHQSDQGLCLHTSAQDTPPHGEGRGQPVCETQIAGQSDQSAVGDLQVQVQMLTKHGQIFTHGSAGAAGFDVYAAHPSEIRPGCRRVVQLDIALSIPAGFYAQLQPRSGLA